MKTNPGLRVFSCLLSIFLIVLTGCQQPAAPTQPPTQAMTVVAAATAVPEATTLPPTRPAQPAPLDTFLAALDALNASQAFGYTMQYTTLVTQQIYLPDQPVINTSTLVSTSDTGSRLFQNGKLNVSVKRKVDFLGKSNGPDIQLDLRLVDGQVYAQAGYTNPAPGLPPMPEGWLALHGPTSLDYWPVLRDDSMRSIVAEVTGDAWALISSAPAGNYRKALSSSVDSITQKEDGAGRVITVTLKDAALRDLARWTDFNNPVDNRILGAIQGTPLTLELRVNPAGQPLALKTKILADIEKLDISGLDGSPAGTKLTIHVDFTNLVTLQLDAHPQAASAPTNDQLAASPAYSGANTLFPYQTLGDLDQAMSQAAASSDSKALWKALDGASMPLIFEDTAVFFYQGPGSQVNWWGDWSDRASSPGRRLGTTQTWWTVIQLPKDAHLEYQIQVDGQAPVVDPLNPHTETGGLGSKSVLWMPAYTPPDYIDPRPEVARGTLTDDLTIQSQSLGYPVHYRVYTPAGYEKLRKLPVLYVTDGQDFLQFGKLNTALDNLIAAGELRPVIAVFIDPRDVQSGKNLREEQFLNNPKYGDFIAKELVSIIDQAYRTDPSPDARAILGASYGGCFTASFGLQYPNVFHLFGIFSPTVDRNPALVEGYRKQERLPLKIFISTGTWSDVGPQAAELNKVLVEKGYPVLYIESNEGHSYGNWRGKFDRLLGYLFMAKE